ncbi:MAG: flagellar biosynthetic protein FliO [Pseudomonadales bacterium]|nr:flagellar biosynthetic protein FliO [Pseudomonadales bacterium]
MNNPLTEGDAIATAAAGGEALSAMGMLGKTVVVLAFVIALILLFSYLLKRFHLPGVLAGQRLRIIASTAVGQRERVVIVEVEGLWLVLGVGGGQVNKLHELPAPANRPLPDTTS